MERQQLQVHVRGGLTTLILLGAGLGWVGTSLPADAHSPSQQPVSLRRVQHQDRVLAQASTVAAVNQIAQRVTVRISNAGGTNNGSGAIVGQQGNTYFVLTAEHVVSRPDAYTITTPDGQQHPVKGSVMPLAGVDLAVVSFSSTVAYGVATLADYDINQEDRPLAFLSGFPGSGASVSRQLSVGTVFPRSATLFAAQGPYSTASGRELVYTAFSQPGMSGGPIFDAQGRVIGIHNASETRLEEDAASGESFPVYLGRSLGVPISTFLGRGTQLPLNPSILKVETTAPAPLNRAALQAILDSDRPERPGDAANAFEWLKYGNRLWRLGRFSEAVMALDRALQLNPNFYQAFYVKGLALSNQEQWPAAIAAFEAALRLEPRFTEALRMKAQALEQLKRYPEALATLEQALQLERNDPLLYGLKGDVLYQLQQYGAAQAAYTEALNRKPAYYFYMQRGRSRFSGGDYPGAYGDYDRAIALQPKDGLSYGARGTLNAALGKSAAALSDLNQALQFLPTASPYRPVLYLSRGLVRFGERDLTSAITDWTTALNSQVPGKTDPSILAQLYTARALAYAQSKDFPRAIADMGQLIALQPQNPEAFYNRGEFYLQAGDPQRAIIDLNQAIRLRSDYADALQTRGLARQTLKDFQGATSDFSQAEQLLNTTITKAPTNVNTATLYVRRANVRLGLGNKQGAISDLQTVARLFQQAGITTGALYQTVQKMLTLLQQ